MIRRIQSETGELAKGYSRAHQHTVARRFVQGLTKQTYITEDQWIVISHTHTNTHKLHKHQTHTHKAETRLCSVVCDMKPVDGAEPAPTNAAAAAVSTKTQNHHHHHHGGNMAGNLVKWWKHKILGGYKQFSGK